MSAAETHPLTSPLRDSQAFFRVSKLGYPSQVTKLNESSSQMGPLWGQPVPHVVGISQGINTTLSLFTKSSTAFYFRSDPAEP